MSRGINKVIIIGNLGANPESRYMPSGSAVTNIRVATSNSWNDKQTGEKHERTEWHRIVIYNRLAEIAGEYLHKGSKVYIEGAIRTNKWQDQNGITRYTTEIIANSMQMLDSRNSAQMLTTESSPNIEQIQSKESDISKSSEKPINSTFQEEIDDDIPF